MATQQVQQGWSQMTAAAQQIIRSGLGSAVRSPTSRRRKKASSTRAATKRKKRSGASVKRRASSKTTGSRMKAGSAAAKAWGRKMKRLRNKR